MQSKQLKLAVIIATKNRTEAIECYALASLTRQNTQNFFCVVWDASDNNATQKVVESRDWGYTIEYSHAPRMGLTSQRNDAVAHVLAKHPDANFVLFIDDDCELSNDAISGVLKTFENSKTNDAAIVNLPMRPQTVTSEVRSFSCRLKHWVKRKLGITRHGATEFLYNYGAPDEAHGIDVEWASGGGMACRLEIFRQGNFFPEAFQKFGSYALGEDFAFSFFLHKKFDVRIVNSLTGYFIHWPAPGARLNVASMAASKWYNFHLLFDALYDHKRGLRKIWLTIKFKLFMIAAAIKLLVRARSLDLSAVLRGICKAKLALTEYHKNSNINGLFRRDLISGPISR